MKTIAQNDVNVGEARTADHIIRDAGFKLDEQSEYVLVQSKTQTAADPAFRAVVTAAIAKLETYPKVTKLRSPLAAGNEGQISEDGHSVLIQFSPKGTYDEATTYIDTIVAGTAQVQKANPDYTVVEAGNGAEGLEAAKQIRHELPDAGPLHPGLEAMIRRWLAADDDFVAARSVIPTPIAGYYGPIAAGPNAVKRMWPALDAWLEARST